MNAAIRTHSLLTRRLNAEDTTSALLLLVVGIGIAFVRPEISGTTWTLAVVGSLAPMLGSTAYWLYRSRKAPSEEAVTRGAMNAFGAYLLIGGIILMTIGLILLLFAAWQTIGLVLEPSPDLRIRILVAGWGPGLVTVATSCFWNLCGKAWLLLRAPAP